MKKILLASVAVVAFGTVSAQAAEPVKLSLGGHMYQWAGFADNGSSNTAASGLSKVDVQDDVAINFTGTTKLDNGLTIGVEVDTDGSQGTTSHTKGGNKNSAKSFATVAGAFGTVEIGEQDNVGALIHNSAPDVGGVGGQDNFWMDWVVAPTGFHDTAQRTYAGDDRSENKVIYITPSWNGLAAGVSYTPSVNPAQTGHTSVLTDSGEVTSTSLGDLYVYGLAYANTFGDVAVKADVGSGNANVGGLHVYQGGLNVSYKGFTLGGSVLKRDTDGRNVDAVNIAKGTSWDAGLSYVTGPYGVSLNYFQGEAANSEVNGNLTYDRDSAWTLAGAYDLGPGVKLTESLFYADYKSATTNAGVNNAGWAAVTGLAVTF